MLHDFRKEVDYYTMANLCSINTKKEAVEWVAIIFFIFRIKIFMQSIN